MSDGKRVALQSIGPVKKDKKCKPISTTIRLNLTLPACNSQTFADFNYNSLILNEKRKKEKNRDKHVKENGGTHLDPYASDDEENMRLLARSFESKYGTPKKKCLRLEDYTELGAGYDENDSFIDNTDAYDEVVPEDQTPELDGFYINKGQLILKKVDDRSSSDDSDSEDSNGHHNSKRRKRPLSSESGSGSSNSSESSDEGDDSEDSDENEGNEEAEIETEDGPKEIQKRSKENKEIKRNGHDANAAIKRPKLSEASSVKVKNKALTELFLKKAVSEKDRNEKRLKAENVVKERSEKRLKPETSERDQPGKNTKLESDAVARILRNCDAVINAVARGEDSKESGIAESKSHSGSSNESDLEEAPNVKENESRKVTPLPEELPSDLLSVVSALKELAKKNYNLGKQQFFTDEVNSLLLRFEKLMRTVPKDKKGGIYDHLEYFFPCRKETLRKRCNVLLLENVEAAMKEPLNKLKSGIDSIMPGALERYHSMCKKYESERIKDGPTDVLDSSRSLVEKIKIPRRRFPWTGDLKSVLCVAVKKRRVYFAIMKPKGEGWNSHLLTFLKDEVVPMWPSGWMKVSSLQEIIQKMAADLLQFKPGALGSKIIESPPNVAPKKAAPEAKPIVDDTLECDLSIRKPDPLHSLGAKSNQHSGFPNQDSSTKVTVSELDVKISQSSVNMKSEPTSSPLVNQANSLDMLSSEIVECIRTSLANSLVSVTPVHSTSYQSSQIHLVNSTGTDNMRNASMGPNPPKRPLNCNFDRNNLESNVKDVTDDLAAKKKTSAASSLSQSAHLISNISQGFNVESQDLSKPQSSNSSSIAVSSQPSYCSSYPQTSSHNPIKVSSVSAINLKLRETASLSPSGKTSLIQPSMAHNPSTSGASVHQVPASLSSQSVISHGLEPSNLSVSSSLTITPVKPTTNTNSFYQPTKASGQMLSGGSGTNVRSEVIVTPSKGSNMPHIKSTNVNYSISGANNVAGANIFSSSHSSSNFSTLLSGSGSNFTNQRGVSSSAHQISHGVNNNCFSTLSSDASVRTHRSQPHSSDNLTLKSQNVDKSNFNLQSRNQVSDKAPHLPPSMWLPSISVEIPRSSSSSPSPGKSVTPSPEKAHVSRKDRILQDSRERGGSDPMMPTLSGPYRSSSVASEQSSLMKNQTQVSSASMVDSYKNSLPMLEPQRCDVPPKSSSTLDPPRAKISTVPSTSESQRVNVVMHTPHSHSAVKLSSPGFIQHSRDVSRTNSALSNQTLRDIQRQTLTKSSPSSSSDSQRANVVMATPQFQETLKDEMNDILAGIPTQMISRTDHYTITNSMPILKQKRKGGTEFSDLNQDLAVSSASTARTDSKASSGRQEESFQNQKAHELARRGILLSRTNCEGSYMEETWTAPVKKSVTSKSSNDISDQRLSGVGTLSSSLSMTELDGGMSLGLPSHLVRYQNDYQRHLFGSSSKTTGPNDHHPL